jgi:hypothetical protein
MATAIAIGSVDVKTTVYWEVVSSCALVGRHADRCEHRLNIRCRGAFR